MLDIKVIRNDPELVATSLETKGEKVDLNSVIDLDKKRRTILEEVETLRSVRNKASDEISSAKKEGINADDKISEMRNVSGKIKELDQPLKELEAELRELMLIFPNMPHKSVPVGKDASDNKLVRDWGKKLESDFELKDHLELAINTFMLDDAPELVGFVEHMTQLNRGRALYSSPSRLGSYLLVDYLDGRRKRRF